MQSAQPRHSLLHGMTAQEALSKYEDELTAFEQSEVKNYDIVYTVGSRRVRSKCEVCTKDRLYIPQPGEQLGYRYLVEKVMGSGAFGQVLKCLDMKDNARVVAIKISKSLRQEN